MVYEVRTDFDTNELLQKQLIRHALSNGCIVSEMTKTGHRFLFEQFHQAASFFKDAESLKNWYSFSILKPRKGMFYVNIG